MENDKIAGKDFQKLELRALLINGIADLSIRRKALNYHSEIMPRLLRASTITTFWYGIGGLVSCGVISIVEPKGGIIPLIAVVSACLIVAGVIHIAFINKARMKATASKRCRLNAKIDRLSDHLRNVDAELGIPHERTRHEISTSISQKEIEVSALLR